MDIYTFQTAQNSQMKTQGIVEIVVKDVHLENTHLIQTHPCATDVLNSKPLMNSIEPVVSVFLIVKYSTSNLHIVS